MIWFLNTAQTFPYKIRSVCNAYKNVNTTTKETIALYKGWSS